MRAARVLVVLTFLPRLVAAQGNPVGPEFRVNTYTTGIQRSPAVAAGSAGSTFVMVWASGAQDGSGYGVFGQRFASSGSPAGPEFRVNTFTTDEQTLPRVASDASDDFVVVWQSGQVGFAIHDIFGQRYDSSAAPMGPEFRVNSYTTSSQTRPSVAADSSGNFVVAWQGAPAFDDNVFGQRYASSGTPLGPEFRVNTYAAGGLPGPGAKPSVSSDSSGNFVVTWEGFYGLAISGQRFSNAGVPLGPEFFVVQSCLPCSNRFPSVASDSAGNFVVVWTSNYPYGPANNAIGGQRYASSGAALGGKFLVSTYEVANQTDAAVAADASGNFVVVWASFGQDGSFGGVFGRRYADSGAPLGAEFLVNSYTTQDQSSPSVSADPLGNFVVTWNSYPQDGSSSGIFAQRYNMIVPVELMRFNVE